MKRWIKKIIARSSVFESMARYIVAYVDSKRGDRDALEGHRKILPGENSVQKGLENIRRRWPHASSKETTSPIFILSAGWRSGSTLIQRLIMSKENVLIWGEPYSHSGLIENLSRPIKSFTSRWPSDEWFVDKYDINNLSGLWVANLYPEVKSLCDAQVVFMNTLFKEPAEARGFERWGLKDVRLTIDDARFLKWIYPKAKFIFLHRNPYDAYKSYRPARDWYALWPEEPVFTPRAFAQHWFKLTDGFVRGYKDVDGFLVRYETLVGGELDVKSLKEYLGMDLDMNILAKKVGGSQVNSREVPAFEFKQIKKVVEPLASELGYYF